MRTQPLPLLLLTGFLGSGKTSTLQHWLAQSELPLRRVAVIINDFGALNVDAALLARRQLELRSITGGCVCCQSFEDLVAQVRSLAENPEIDLVWIEASGLADPEELLDHLSAPELQDITILRRLILVIDSSDFPCSWRGRAVQEEQVRYADLVLLNKIDRVDDPTRQTIEETLRALNPEARIVSSRHGQVPPPLLSGESPHVEAKAAACSHDHDDPAHVHFHRDEHGGLLPHSASTFFLPVSEPVERGVFQRFLDALPPSVFRAKGFVRFTDSPDQLHTFQQVRDQAELLVLPLLTASAPVTGLVFIGPHLEEARILELAQSFNARLIPAP